MGFLGILWQEYVIFKRKFWSITSSIIISPILYIITFGWGIGGRVQVNGQHYLQYIIPGIIAMTTMTTSYSSIAVSINMARIYDRTFEEYMIAPINMRTYSLGKIVAAALRGLYSALVIIALICIARININFSIYNLVIIVLNCLVFAAIGFTVGVIIDSHADMGKFTSFIITPMSFLCGTFFPLNKMPYIIRVLIWILPLTHTSTAVRSSNESIINMLIHLSVLVVYFFVLFFLSERLCEKTE